MLVVLTAGAQLRQVMVPHSLSLAWRLAQAVAAARHAKQDAAAAIAAAGGGCVLLEGAPQQPASGPNRLDSLHG